MRSVALPLVTVSDPGSDATSASVVGMVSAALPSCSVLTLSPFLRLLMVLTPFVFPLLRPVVTRDRFEQLREPQQLYGVAGVHSHRRYLLQAIMVCQCGRVADELRDLVYQLVDHCITPAR